MKILQVNTSVSTGSTGKITNDLGNIIIKEGNESFIAYGNMAFSSNSVLVKIGNKTDFIRHVFRSRLFDLHGFGSSRATKSFIREVESINPDIIHLHNLHGYYLNIDILFEYLKAKNKPVVWTFHDCWPFTGHCSHFEAVQCLKWQKECYCCPNIHGYPKSWFFDNSFRNFKRKKEIFNGLSRMIIISPSEWLAKHLRNSFLSGYDILVINNAIDIEKFKPGEPSNPLLKYLGGNRYILGVANRWNKLKGLDDFIMLRRILDPDIQIVLIGLSRFQTIGLPRGITGVRYLEKKEDIASFYSGALSYINPTYSDNFPTTNIEALACGTPVITYDTGGSPESIDENTGFVVKKGDIENIKVSIEKIIKNGRENYRSQCISRAINKYDKNIRFIDYMNIYKQILQV